jgi:glutamate 5-kinase
VILTGTDGLFDRDPAKPGASLITRVSYGEKLGHVSTDGRSRSGRGGMSTKLTAIHRVTALGTPVILSNYRHKSPILDALTGCTGTLFEGKRR